MLKVFLAEDESVVREGLRDNVPWQQYGFTFAGEAADGELALAGIRKVKPDLLITDIRMPFMDGLSLCHVAHSENPNMKIIIISGFDDFEYARRAISEGVDQYLSKPVTRRVMEKALQEVRKKIESETEQENYLRQYRSELQEYEQYYRRAFFEHVFEGSLSVQEIYAQADKLSIHLDGPSFNLIFCSLDERSTQAGEILSNYFLRYPEFIFFRWSMSTFGVVVKGEADAIAAMTQRAVSEIRKVCTEDVDTETWYVATGTAVDRFSLLKDCYKQVNHIFSCRFLSPKEHVLTNQIAERLAGDHETGKIDQLDVTKIAPEILNGFLRSGSTDEIDEFSAGYVESVREGLASRMFRDYLLLNMRFTVAAYMQENGMAGDENGMLPGGELSELSDTEQITAYLRNLLSYALGCRDRKEGQKGGQILRQTLEYIDQNYCDQNISLNAAAEQVNVTPNYLSAMFSREMHQTFVEYLTAKRIDKAKALLSSAQLHTAQVAEQVGYRDPHYFSFVFKKTVGMSLREYRNRMAQHTT